MPRCEIRGCDTDVIPPEELYKHSTGTLMCRDCFNNDTPEYLSEPEDRLILGREFDYSINYTKKDGLRAGVRLGGATLSFEVSPSELDRTFGPAR